MIVQYLEEFHKPSRFESHTHYLFPFFVLDLMERYQQVQQDKIIELPLTINPNNNE